MGRRCRPTGRSPRVLIGRSRAIELSVEAGALARVAGGTARLDESEDSVAVAVVAELSQPQRVPRGLPLAPDLLARAAVEVKLAGLDGEPQALLVRVGQGQDLAAGEVLRNARHQAFLVKRDLLEHSRIVKAERTRRAGGKSPVIMSAPARERSIRRLIRFRGG